MEGGKIWKRGKRKTKEGGNVTGLLVVSTVDRFRRDDHRGGSSGFFNPALPRTSPGALPLCEGHFDGFKESKVFLIKGGILIRSSRGIWAVMTV